MGEPTVEDALARIGGVERMQAHQAEYGNRLRIGQAWFNLLPAEDKERLRGHVLDPFYRDDWGSVLTALRFLRVADSPT